MTGFIILGILALALIITITERGGMEVPPWEPEDYPQIEVNDFDGDKVAEIWSDDPCIVMHPDTCDKLLDYCGKKGEAVSINGYSIITSLAVRQDIIYLNDSPPPLITDFTLKYNIKIQ